MKLNKALCAGLLCAIAGMSAVTATTAQAEGFALFEWSARGNALGGAVVGRADDPSAIAFNPAGITQLPGAQVQAGVSFMMPSIDIKTNDGKTTSNKPDTFMAPNGYYSQQLNDNWWIGLGAYSRFGLGLDFGSSWAGADKLDNVMLETFSVTPVLAYKVNDKLSISFGFEVMKAYLDLENRSLDASADSMGLGALAAIHYKPAQDWSIGLSYKSQVKQSFKGDGTVKMFKGTPYPDATNVTGDIVLPDEVLFGVAYQATEKLSIEVGAVWTNWSNYKQLSLHMDNPVLVGMHKDNEVTSKNWKNTMRYNVGVEYQALDWLDLRCAYTFDESPVPSSTADYMVPTNDRHLISLGTGMRYEDWTFDLSYTYIIATDRSLSENKDLHGMGDTSDNGVTHVVGLSVGYKF